MLHLGKPLHLSYLTTAIDFREYQFAVEFNKLFLHKFKAPSSELLLSVKQCFLWHFRESPRFWELLLFVMGPFLKLLDFN